jgi:prepilin-type N-terminal cleavage/methylation domain-containing protein
MRTFSPRRPEARAAFTLVEMMAALAVMLLILVALADFTGTVHHLWRTGETDPFAEAEGAFETIGAHLAGATLESYQDYADATGTFATGATAAAFVPDHPARRSDLAPGSRAAAGSGLVMGSSSLRPRVTPRPTPTLGWSASSMLSATSSISATRRRFRPPCCRACIGGAGG